MLAAPIPIVAVCLTPPSKYTTISVVVAPISTHTTPNFFSSSSSVERLEANP